MMVWVVYRSPIGAPAPFAVCAYDCEPGAKPRAGAAQFVQTVEAARARMPEGLAQRDRQSNDSALILEVWTNAG